MLEKSWLERGTLLMICGYRRGDSDFVAKRYKNSIFNHKVKKILSIDDNGDVVIQSDKIGAEEE